MSSDNQNSHIANAAQPKMLYLTRNVVTPAMTSEMTNITSPEPRKG